jgi:hypothetical protein
LDTQKVQEWNKERRRKREEVPATTNFESGVKEGSNELLFSFFIVV